MSNTNKFLKSSIFNATEKLLRIAINFVIFILMSNALSVEEMGKYNFYLTAFAMLSVFSSFGLTENATKILIDKQCNIKALNLLIAIKLLFSLFFAVLGYYSLLERNFYFSVGLILSSFSLSLQFLESLALGKLILKVNTFVLILMSTIKIWACLTGKDLTTFCQIFAVEVFLQSLLLFLISYNKSKSTPNNDSYYAIFRGLNFKGFFYIWFSASISILYTKVDQFFVKYYLGESDIGLYTYATRIIDYGLLLPSLILSSLMGYLYSLNKGARNALYSLVLLVSLSIFIAINAMTQILTGYITPQYEQAGGIVIILSIGLPFALLRAMTGKFMIIDGQNKPFLIRATMLLIINIILCAIFINIFGLYGAALANMLTMIISGLFIDLIHKDTHVFFHLKCKSLVYLKSPQRLYRKIKKLG